MPLGTPVSAGPPTGSSSGNVVHSTGIPNQWQTIIDATGAGSTGFNVQDAATITDPNAEITNDTTHIFQINGRGSQVALRAVYDDTAGAITTSPVVAVFGRAGNDEWQRLVSVAGNQGTATITLGALGTVVADGTSLYSDVTDDEIFNLAGCDQVLVGVQTILNTPANEANAYLQAKAI